MHNLALALDGSWRVLLAGLLLGAGLPVVFALGVRSMAYAAAAPHGPRVVAGRTAGTLCLAVILLAIGLGITYIAASGFGMTLSFGHGYPALVAKH